MNLAGVAEEIQHRIIHIFGRDMEGRRATNGGSKKLDTDPHFRDYVWFYEFFHADSGKGLGASHQTGWSGLVAYHILQSGASCRLPKTPKSASLRCPIRFCRLISSCIAPRGIVNHYFDVSHLNLTLGRIRHLTTSQETIDYQSEYGGETPSVFSAYSAADNNTLGDISPDAL